MEDGRRYESMDESLWGAAFLFTDRPHPKRIEGFPLDSISLDIASGKYFYDLEGNVQDVVAAETGIAEFFQVCFLILVIFAISNNCAGQAPCPILEE